MHSSLKKNQPELLADTKLCFSDSSAPIASRTRHSEKGHGRITSRRARSSQLLHGYSTFPGLHQVIEIKRKVKHISTGRETNEVEYGVTSLSPRRVNARAGMMILRRHWSIENKNNYVRDDSWREDRQVWRRGRAAYVMSMLLSIALNLLRTDSPHWLSNTPLTKRAAVVNDLSMRPTQLMREAS